MSVRTVQRHIATLEEAGLLRRERRSRGEGRGRTTDRYYLGDQGDNPGLTRQTTTTNTTIQDDLGDTVVVAEPEENRKGTETLAAAPRPRQRDLLFEALVQVSGQRLDRLTKSERGRINKAAQELRQVGATPDQVTRAAATYRREYPNAALTATALAANWSKFAPAPAQNPVRVERCPVCMQMLDADHDEFRCQITAQQRSGGF
jgi:DNA-binding transcriptional ArsR family regulator